MSECRKHILIVDDEPSILQILKNVFLPTSYRLSFAQTGSDAQKILSEQTCDLLITDNDLPDVQGMDLVSIAKKVNNFIEIIVLTGFDSKQARLEAINNQVYAYLLKQDALDDVYIILNQVKKAFEKQDILIENHNLIRTLRHQNAKLQFSIDELSSKQEELEHVEENANFQELLSRLANEISLPLKNLKEVSRQINQTNNSHHFSQYASQIDRSVRNISLSLSEFCRFQDQEILAKEDTVHSVVCSVIEEIKDSIREIDVNINSFDKVMVDAKDFKRIFRHLLTNAVGAINQRTKSDERGTIDISCVKEQNIVTILVRDNGIGVKPANLPKIFDPRYTTKEGESFGMGLSISYRLLVKHGGRIEAFSPDEQGCSFKITLPTMD